MKAFGIVGLVIAGVFGLGVLGTALNIITIPWLKLNSQVQTERDIVQKTYNADNALYNYRWFKDRHEAILATEAKVELAKEELTGFCANGYCNDPAKMTFEDKTELSRLRSIYLGLRNHYQDLVAEYNSRAKQVDRAVFKDDLPLFFSIQPF